MSKGRRPKAETRGATRPGGRAHVAAGPGSLEELISALDKAAPYFISESFCDFSWCFEVSACAAELTRRRGFSAQVQPYSLIVFGPNSVGTAGLSPRHWHTLLTRRNPSTPRFSECRSLVETPEPRDERLAHVALVANDGVRGAFADLTIGQLRYSAGSTSRVDQLPVTLSHMGMVDTDNHLVFGSWRIGRLPPMWSAAEMKRIAKRVAKIDVSARLPVFERFVEEALACSRRGVELASVLGPSPVPTGRCATCGPA